MNTTSNTQKPTPAMIANARGIYQQLRAAGFSKPVATLRAKQLAEEQHFEAIDRATVASCT